MWLTRTVPSRSRRATEVSSQEVSIPRIIVGGGRWSVGGRGNIQQRETFFSASVHRPPSTAHPYNPPPLSDERRTRHSLQPCRLRETHLRLLGGRWLFHTGGRSRAAEV